MADFLEDHRSRTTKIQAAPSSQGSFPMYIRRMVRCMGDSAEVTGGRGSIGPHFGWIEGLPEAHSINHVRFPRRAL